MPPELVGCRSHQRHAGGRKRLHRSPLLRVGADDDRRPAVGSPHHQFATLDPLNSEPRVHARSMQDATARWQRISVGPSRFVRPQVTRAERPYHAWRFRESGTAADKQSSVRAQTSQNSPVSQNSLETISTPAIVGFSLQPEVECEHISLASAKRGKIGKSRLRRRWRPRLQSPPKCRCGEKGTGTFCRNGPRPACGWSPASPKVPAPFSRRWRENR